MNRTLLDKLKVVGVFFIYATVFLGGLVSVLDLFGLLDSESTIKARIPTVTLLLISGLIGYITWMGSRVDSIGSSMLTIQAHINQDTIEKIKSLRSQLDKNLEIIYGDMISDSISNFELALKERTIHFNDLELFRYLYKRTLERFPRATFLATSLPYERFFWKNQMMEEAIRKFIDDGGAMKRIFFVRNKEELGDEEVSHIIAAQCALGVEVYVTVKDKIPRKLRRIFVVDQERRIAWEVTVDQDSEITEVTATSNPLFIDEYVQCFESLIGSSSTNKMVTQICMGHQ